MFKAKIVHVGKIKSGPFKDLVDEYTKRLSVFAKVTHVPLNELRIPDGGFRILLTERGETMTSKAFAQSINVWTEQHQRELVFIIAGPFGHDPSVESNADVLLSLSPMTMPHDLAHVVLLEQLYRAGTILQGKTYHY